jgi:IS605 OrfB family transposase
MSQTENQLTPEDLLGIEVNRCYRSKVQCRPGDELYLALENTHRIFNEKVALVVRYIQAVLSNKENPEFAKLTEWAILNISPAGQCASHFANPFIRDSEAGPKHLAYKKVPKMVELFNLCKERGDRWYDRDELFGTEKGVSGFATEVNQAAIEKVSGYLKLKDLWRNGDFTPPRLLEREDFIKTYSTFLKKSRDIFQDEDNRGFECLTELLDAKDTKLKGHLADIHATQLVPEHDTILTALERAYREYSDKAIGKDSWLKQKWAFEKQHSEFLAQYQVILEAYRKTLNKNDKQTTGETDRIPRAWVRDPNFLQVIEQEGPKGSFGSVFKSPLQDEATLKEWAELKAKQPDWPQFDDINKIGPHWDARLFYVKKFEELNSDLFSKTGWFGLLKAFRPYEGKQYTEFRKPPALRFPDPRNHPEWLTLSDKGCFQYRNLRVIGPALIEMTTKLIEPTANIFKDYTFQVKLDNRLKTLHDAETYEVPKGRWFKNKETGQLEFDWPADENGELPFEKELFYPWFDKNDQKTYRISIKGGNLLHQKKSFYLHFRYTYKAPFNKGIKNLEQNHSELSYKAGTKLLSFDLGQKSDAVIAMMQDGESVKFKPFHFKKKAIETKSVYFQWLKLPGGNSFQAINHAEKIRQKKRSKKAKAEAHWRQDKKMPARKVKGLFLARNQETFKRLNRYIENCREQHCKQLAGVIVKIAKQNGCQGIVHENLENYRMSVKQRRFENRRLQTWIAQKTMDFLKTLCEAEGILCFPKSAAMTSQTCNACMSWGVRFNIPSKTGWESRLKYRSSLAEYKHPIPLIEPGGDWFLCSKALCMGKKEPENPNTRYIIQADANAAKNLLKRAFLKEYWGAKVEGKDEKEMKKNKDALRDELQKWLIEVHAPKLSGKIFV